MVAGDERDVDVGRLGVADVDERQPRHVTPQRESVAQLPPDVQLAHWRAAAWVARDPAHDTAGHAHARTLAVINLRPAPILSVFPALIVHSELKSVHPGFPVAFIFLKDKLINK